MFSQQYRLKGKKTFNRIYKNGQRFRTENFGLCFLKNGLENPRFGIVISNKIEPKASKRNRIKRQIREIIKSDYLTVLPNDYIITVLKKPAEFTYKQIKDEVDQLFRKLKS